MFDTRIEICEQIATKNALNERRKEVSPVAVAWAQVTEFGGKENMYASRIINVGEIVYTTRFREVKTSMYVYHGGRVMKIESVHNEGRRRWTHIKVKVTDNNDLRYVRP